MRILIDSPDRICFETPSEVIWADQPAQVPAALGAVEAALASGKYVAGWFCYELGYVLEPRLASLTPNAPLLRLGVFDAPAKRYLTPLGRAYVGPLVLEWDAAAYGKRFEVVKRLIAAGDIYQANLSFRKNFAFAGDALALYERLRNESGAGYCAFVQNVDDDGTARQIVSLSPELFFDITEDGVITARPMKGTAPRMDNDDVARTALGASIKDRAENLMIVDLLRNDLGRIAEIGSVAVSDMFEIETYPTLHTMVSTITARKRPEVKATEILKALFPCGSITGAPKIRAMEILQALETSPRGAYCGSIGYFAPNGAARFNVAIRTLSITNGQGELGVGGGIVHSDEAAEYAECRLKSRFFEANRRPLQLIETLRHEGTFLRLQGHLSRMADSAQIFGLHFDFDDANLALRQAVDGRNEPLRVRLLLDESGCHSAVAAPLEPNPPHWKYRLSSVRIMSTDLLQRHKTDWRDTYQEDVTGVDELLYCNEKGELAEGARSNIFVERDGQLFTPPIMAGALPGLLRAELLAQGKAKEATLTPADLQTGHVFCGNSLRGLIPAIEA